MKMCEKVSSGGRHKRLHATAATVCSVLWFMYSVMQSDGNSFCGDVVLDSFNIEHSDEDSILDKKYEKQIIWKLYYKDFEF